jgi:hypothetical protein
MSTEDPFADPHPHDANPAVSPADTIRVPEYVLSVLVSISVHLMSAT